MNNSLIIPTDQEVEVTEQRLPLDQPDQIRSESKSGPEGKLILTHLSYF